MNILYIAYSCDPYFGSEDKIGWSIPIENAKVNSTYVITKMEHKENIEYFTEKYSLSNITFFYVDIPEIYKKIFSGTFYSGRLNIWHRQAFKIAKELCLRNRIDIIHQITPVEFRSIGPYGRIPGIKFICGPLGGGEFIPEGLKDYRKGYAKTEYLRNMLNYYSRLKLTLMKTFKFCDYVMFANKETYDFLRKVLPQYLKVCILPETGLKEDELYQAKRECRKKSNENICKFLVAGRLIYRKGHLLLFDVLKNLPSSFRYHCTIVGDGPERKHLQEYCDKNNLNNFVTFAGNIPFDEMDQVYKEADIFILPSIRETTGSVVLEAMVHGLPVVTINRFGGASIVDDSAGWLYNGHTKQEYIRAFKEILKECITNPELVKNKSAKAEEISAQYVWNKKLEIYHMIYQEVFNYQ